MQQVVPHIVNLLHDHDCVIVPGFGGFVASYQPAKMHPTSFIFNSPSKSLAFNINLVNNDGLLMDAIARAEAISHNQADFLIRNFVEQVRSALGEHKPVKLSGIGRLSLDVEGQLKFLPDNAENFLLSSYGLYTFQAEPVLHDNKTIALEPVLVPPAKKKAKKKKSAFDRLLPIAAVFLFVMFGLQVLVQTNVNGFNTTELFGMDKIFARNNYILEKFEPVRYDINPTIFYIKRPKADPVIIQDQSAQNGQDIVQDQTQETPAEVSLNTSIRDSEYIIVAGSFYTEKMAQRVVDRLKDLGYDGYVRSYGKYQIAAFPVPDGISHKEFRKQFVEATQVKGAWITKN
ncbi:MAG: hypothetical protein R2794_12440 [Chitinophagales bacterium]